MTTPHDIVAFWQAAGPAKWFVKDADFDAEIRAAFTDAYEAAARSDLAAWEQDAMGALALVILLDQFPRNMFRNDARTFAADAAARAVAERALAKGFDMETDRALRPFFYLPFMHSERLADQDRSIALYTVLGEPDNLRYAELHRDIIRRFGRFPHRNAVLGRATTAQAEIFLDSGGFAG